MTEPGLSEPAITHDTAYETVAQDDFAVMLMVERYGRRSDAFDTIIGTTHDHFWDPHNPPISTTPSRSTWSATA